MRSGPFNDIFFYIKTIKKDTRNDIIIMTAMGHIQAYMEQYSVGYIEILSRKVIYSAIFVNVHLMYEKCKVFIPNNVQMEQKFLREQILKKNEFIISEISRNNCH